MLWSSYVGPLRAGLRASAIVLLLIPFALPLLLLLLASLNPPGRVPVPGAIWPEAPGLAAYQALFATVPMARALLNSLLIVLAYVPTAVILAAAGGLGLRCTTSRLRFVALVILVMAASIPLAVTWLPRFLAFQGLGLGDSWWPLWAPSLMGGNALLVLLYFVSMSHIPQAQFEAARLEGLGWLAIWWRVAMPQVRPASMVAVVLATAWCWASFQDALLYLQTRDAQTAPMLLYELELLGASHWALLMAGSAMVALPLLIVIWWLPAALDHSLESA